MCTSWGHASSGKLGYVASENSQLQAMQVSVVEKKATFLDVSCGEGHTLLLQSNLQLLACGTNTYGQIGNTDAS